MRNRLLLLLAAAVALLCGLVARDGGGFIDLQVYRFGGAAVLDDGRLYAEGTPGSGLPFTYPPFAALVMAPLAAVPFPLLVAAWSGASVLVLGWVLRRFLAETGCTSTGYADRAWLVPAATALAVGLEPVWSNLAFGQVNIFLMALVVGDLLAADRRRAGWLVGVAAGLKLTPLLFLVFLLLVRRPRAAANAGLAFLATIGIGFALAPEASGAYWTRLLWDAGRVGGVPYAGNQSMLAGLFRVLGREPSTLLWFLVAGAAAGLLLLAGAFAWHRGNRGGGVCLAAFAMLVASPISWNHHWVWAAPAAVVLLGSSRVVASAWVVVFASCSIWWPPHRDDLELGWTPAEHLVGNAYLVAALLLPAYLTVLAVRTRRREPAPWVLGLSGHVAR